MLLQVVQGKPAWVWLSKLDKGSSKQHSSSTSSRKKRSSNTQRNTVFIGLSPLTAAATAVNGKHLVSMLSVHLLLLCLFISSGLIGKISKACTRCLHVCEC
jgi:hypothetical protein